MPELTHRLGALHLGWGSERLLDRTLCPLYQENLPKEVWGQESQSPLFAPGLGLPVKLDQCAVYALELWGNIWIFSTSYPDESRIVLLSVIWRSQDGLFWNWQPQRHWGG